MLDMFEKVSEEQDTVFYGTQHLYYMIRFYFTLYERFLKVHEISAEFEENSHSKLLTNEVTIL